MRVSASNTQQAGTSSASMRATTGGLSMQRRSQYFGLGGGGARPISPDTFSLISRSRPDSVGGVVDSLGGGVVAEFFPVPAGQDQSNYLNSGTFWYISH